ncbi:DNA-binding PadR family transcriptional regulator [Allocatelliglobosispora scoriae]|uniref:DNA-binding PadR family transcriptional regulator n=1 Tax=Allocatelliglobosispora scoriae TaxID=643052 RepID=A0A841C2C1_9ACTN|nr:PadR family transcriptional regulator [Allocatelliglobosispora scoriae]MBB5873449.1 DNA-binding PadR family transcriptional regulator [Allocatelliglobosispora scoriae]
MSGLPGFGRFSEPALLILISLAGGAKHGYAMQDDIAVIGGERPGPGTLYGAIKRLEEQGFIEALPETDRRKPYGITDAGREALQAELARMRAMSTTGLRRLATS